MKKLHVNLGDNSYDIHFAADFSGLCQALSEAGAPRRLHIVTDTNVAELYLSEVERTLCEGGYDVSSFAFRAGERNKNMDTILKICASCVEEGLDRRSMIAALGGGVVGDMAGFAAAIFMRGIPFVQIPTTLLAQSDSSVGGKTGVDFDGGKNLLGAFHQPKAVYINVSTVKTLPEEEFISGMGEVIKHGIIRDGEFFSYLEENSEAVKKLDPAAMIETSYKNCSIKAAVVEEDERETGARADLNFGHTIGHAVEAALDFSLTHGQCVGLGMIAAADIALGRGLITAAEYDRIVGTLKKYGFKTSVALPEDEEIERLMAHDKKKTNGRLKFVLPAGIGKVVQVTDVSPEEIKRAVMKIRGVRQ